MITGFEKETAPLSQSELELVPHVVQLLVRSEGLHLTAGEIEQRVFYSCGVRLTGPRLRRILHYVRVEGIVQCVVADSNGYRVTLDTEVVKKYLRSLEERIGAIYAIHASLSRQLSNLEDQQTRNTQHA